MKQKIENAAYAIVCKMIDWGMIESEIEGKETEKEIQDILKIYFK